MTALLEIVKVKVMGSKTNRYRSGAKNPEQQVLVTKLEGGRYAVSVFDTANWRIAHFTSPEVDGDREIAKDRSGRNG